ncbi:MAG: PDZ domain-containing protein [Candidatus Binataceae bacterium]
MTLKKMLAGCAAAALIAAGANFAGAQTSNQLPAAASAPRNGVPAYLQGGPQTGNSDSTLVIAPQPHAIPYRPNTEDIPAGSAYKPGETGASTESGYSPDSGNETGNGGGAGFHRRPYLGISVRYTTKCYLGAEEHGLEILTVDPDSPAKRAGLRGGTGPSTLGASEITAGGMLGLSPLVNKLIAKSGSMGLGGDLIVAVDDHRVRTQNDLDEAMARLKPGDTMYLTVIRPIPDGHKTLKIAVHVGALGQPFANAGGTE